MATLDNLETELQNGNLTRKNLSFRKSRKGFGSQKLWAYNIDLFNFKISGKDFYYPVFYFRKQRLSQLYSYALTTVYR